MVPLGAINITYCKCPIVAALHNSLKSFNARRSFAGRCPHKMDSNASYRFANV